jgi:hypothetical protein
VGSVVSVLELLVVVVSAPTPIRTGLVATIDVFLGVFGYLLGVRWIGGTTILSSTVATPISWSAYWHHNATGIYSPNLVEA